MRKILTLVAVLGLTAMAAVGCKASGEIGDPDNATSIALPR
jgi:hypothetical protein